jgi:hypothetical protein
VVPCVDGLVDLRLTDVTKSLGMAVPPQPSWAPGHWWGGHPGGHSLERGGNDFRSSGHQCDQIVEDGGVSATIAGARSVAWWSEAVILVAAQW